MKQFKMSTSTKKINEDKKDVSVKYVEELWIRQMMLVMYDVNMFTKKYTYIYAMNAFKDNILYEEGIEKNIKTPKDYPFFVSEFSNMLLYKYMMSEERYLMIQKILATTLRLIHLRKKLEKGGATVDNFSSKR